VPILTNRERLSPRPCPDVHPWGVLTTRQLIDWLGVSLQTCYNWESRRSGPPRRMLANRRCIYLLADVQHWLEGEASPTSDERIRNGLADHWRDIAAASWWSMPVAEGTALRKLLAKLPEVTSRDIDTICSAIRNFNLL